MKRNLSTLSRLAIVLLATQILTPTVAIAASLTIPVGMPITLSFNEAVTPSTTQVGSIVHLSVLRDVLVNDQVVISAGSPATAEVTRSEKPGSIGKPASISLEARSVQAVDGTMVPVTGSKFVEGENKQTSTLIITILCCVVGLFLKGGDVEIPAGSTMDCTVQVPIEVEV